MVGDQCFNWYEADHWVKWDSEWVLSAEVATNRRDFGGLEIGLSTQAFRLLKRATCKVDDATGSPSAFNAALGRVWHEARAHSAFSVGDICVRCHEEVEDLGSPQLC
eukprot:401505-Amphidinium_carterae.1